jgi:glyoxylase-like metal-dependent hydrolase (beta-lactamase superfamily II)
MRRARFFLLAVLLGCAGAAEAQYEVFAIRYATIAGFPVSALVQGADKTRKLDIAMMVWLVRGRGRNILVDSGFYRPRYLEKWKPADFLRPDEAVARAGVRADEVTDVIITHFHWDHADGADLFPKAQIWIQKEEYEHYAKDLTNLDAAKAAGRLHLVDGDREILPGIRVFTGGKHTFASQYVVVGNIVLASDIVYLYENLEKHVPIAQTVDAQSNLKAQERMKALAGDRGVIVPGHDPEVMQRFPKVNDRVVRIVAQR